MEDDCDFDTLAALLDDDDRKENDTPLPQKGVVLAGSTEDSSDDDIDDDELDRLAALVEEERDAQPPEPHLTIPGPPPIQPLSEQITPGETATATEGEEGEGHGTIDEEEEAGENDASQSNDDGGDSGDVSPTHVQDEENDDEINDSDEDSAIREQLLLMQKQMALLTQQLDKKKKKDSPKTNSKSSGSPNREKSTERKARAVKDPLSSVMTSDETKGSSPSSKQTNGRNPDSNKASKAKAPKECNIFDIIDQEKTCGKGSAMQKPKHKSRDNGESSQPWERKKSVPSSGYKLSTSSAKTCPSAPSKELQEKLSNTVEKITTKRKAEASSGTKEKRKTSFYGKKEKDDDLEKNLFGSDSDSDWGDMEGEKQSELSDHGKEFYKSLKKKRVAHAANFDGSDLEALRDKPQQSKNWKSSIYGNAAYNGIPAASGGPSTSMAKAAEDKDVTLDPFSGIRMIKPLVSSIEMKRRMEGRRLIKLSHIHSKRNTAAVEGDWVTIGVIAHKGEPRMSQNNKQYSVWKLTDLDDCDQVVNFFLFGDVHKAHWKTIQGSVIGLLNPTLMKNAEKYSGKDQDSTSVMLKDKLQLMLMGTSKDLGVCKGRTKSGKQCTNYINRNKHEFCTYHVQAQYKRASAKRGELSSIFSGVTPKNHEKKLFSNKNSTVIYGGKTYTSNSMPQAAAAARKKKDGFSVKQLQSHAVMSGGASSKVSTLSLHNLIPEDKQKLEDYKEKLKEREKASLKKHEQFHDLLTTPTVGSMNFVKHLVKKEQIQVEENKKGPAVSIKAADLLKMVHQQHAGRQAARGKAVAAEAAPSPALGGGGPTLGRGLAPGFDIEFDIDAPMQKARPSKDKIKNELRKKKALAKVINSGGITKKDPNAVKKKMNSDVREKVQKRVAQEAFDDQDEQSDEPAKKKSRYLGNIDLNDPKIKELLNKKSKHAASLSEEEQQKLEAYFEVLEKKEAMEDQMAKVTKQKVKAVICKQCKYKALSPNASCKEERHELTWVDAVKRWFACANCSTKRWALDRYPSDPCRNCGSSKYEKSSMLYEKKGPKLASEELLLRGEERKYVNS